MDEVSEVVNLSLYLGHYSGTGDISSYQSTSISPTFKSRFALTHSTLLTQEPDVRDRLCNWALLQSAQMRSPSVPPFPLPNLISSIPNVQAANTIAATATKAFMQQASDKTCETMTKVSSNMLSGNTSLIGKDMGVNENSVLEQDEQLTTADSFQIGLTNTNTAETYATGTNSTELPLGGSCIDGQPESKTSPALLSLLIGEVVQDYQAQPAQSAPPDHTTTVPVETTFCLENNDPMMPPNPIDPTQHILPPSVHADVVTTKQVVSSRRPEPVTIAPASITPKNGPDPLTTHSSSEDEQTRRAERRKIQNRLAAQRSNLKRKQKMQRLKREIGEEEIRKAELAEKEKLLREENNILRLHFALDS